MKLLVLLVASAGGAAALQSRGAAQVGTALKADVFGLETEAALKQAARKGQDEFTGALDVAQEDPFGYADEAATTAAQRSRVMTADPFGYAPYDEAARPRRGMSRAVPFLERPAVLDEVALPGDFGFDPLGLADSTERLLSMRDAEIRHARLAMLAAVGWPAAELLHPYLASTAEAPSVVAKLGGLAPSVLNGGLDAVPPVFWVVALTVTFAAELAGMQARASGKMPGDLGLRFGAGTANQLFSSEKAVADAELVNGRLAMLAIVGFVAQELATKLNGIPVPVVAQTPQFFHPFFF